MTLAIKEFRGRIVPHSSGVITWTRGGGSKSSVGYRVTWRDVPTITLDYCWRDSEDVEIPIRLQTTPANFGGERYWFTCPLTVDGVPCNRRVGNVHLPPGARYFGCRTCHDLTYVSCQEAHQAERLFAGFGADADVCRLLASRLRDGSYGS